MVAPLVGRSHGWVCAGERCKLDTIGVGVTGALRPWPVLCHGCAERERRSAASSTQSGRTSPARRVGGPFRPRMCEACAGERRQFNSIGVGVTDTPSHGCAGRARESAAISTRSAWASPARCVCGPFHATDVRGMRGGASQVRLDRRWCHRRAASVALSGHGCAGRARGSAAISTRPTRVKNGGRTVGEPLKREITRRVARGESLERLLVHISGRSGGYRSRC